MHKYPIDIIASREDIKQIEFNKSKIFILFRDGLIGEYKYDFIGSIRRGKV
jgi:hypothetical protein